MHIAQRGIEVLPGQEVRIVGSKAKFVVLFVDHERHLADLLRLGSVHSVETVPLGLLRLVKEPGPVDEMEASA